MIRVAFLALPQRHQWQAVACQVRVLQHLPACQSPCRCPAPPRLVVGFVRFSVGAGGVWVARLRERTDCAPIRVSTFSSRTDAAEWLLVTGGYARPPQTILERAAA